MSDVTIYTDGSFSSSRNAGGIGVVFVKDGKQIASYNKMFKNTSNNQMELTAVIVAIKTILKNNIKSATIITDSQYVIGCATKGWHRKKNVRLWYRYDLLKQELDSKHIKINFSWVHGHNGDKFNEIADKLAVMASQELDLKI
jgi:ribonuclease HI